MNEKINKFVASQNLTIMFKKIVLTLVLLPLFALSQVGINTTDPNATLEMAASNPASPTITDGVLIPRIDNFPATNPTADQDSMLIYLTTAVGTSLPGFYYWNNITTTWLPFVSSRDSWELEGNTATDDSINFIGTTDDEELVFKTNNTEFARLTTKGQFELSDTNSNIFIGKQAGENVTIGRRNIYLGNNAGLSSVFNRDNIAIGDSAATTNILGNNSIAIGTDALENSDESDFSIAIGSGALNNRSKSFYNVGVGHRTLSLRTTGDRNTAIGADAGRTTSGSNSVFIGYSADEENDGGNNVVIGAEAGIQNLTAFEPTGRVLIGNQVWQSQPGNNVLAIENSSSVTPLLYGEFDNDILRIGGQLQIGSSDDTTPGSVYAFPTTDGTNGQVLTTDGTGTVTWQDGGAATADADWYEEGTTASPDDINDNIFTQGNVGIGNNSPTANLHLTGVTVPAGDSVLLSQNFDSAALGNVSDTPGAFPYENNNNTGCQPEDGWQISVTDNVNSMANTCTTCDNQRAIIDFSAVNTNGCAQNSTLVAGEFIPTTTSIDVSFNYGFEAFTDGTDVFTITLENTVNAGNSIVLVNNTNTTVNQSYTSSQTVNAGELYRFVVNYTAAYDYGATIDNILVTELVSPASVNYVFRLDDGQQQEGYVLTSDANGNATWKENIDNVNADDQTLELIGNDLSILNGNTVTLSDDWKKGGNIGTISTLDFLGTRDNQPLVIRTNNLERLRVTTNGRFETSNSGRNIYFGKNAGLNDNFAFNHSNIGIGENALSSNVVQTDNTAVGIRAMQDATGLDTSVAFGNNALANAITGSNSVAVGRNALLTNQNSDRNTAVGSNALGGAASGNSNTALGYKAGTFATEDGNVFIGSLADEQNAGGQNVVIGYQSGKVDAFGLNLDGRVFIGYEAGQNNPNENVLAIENSSSVSPLIGGDFANDRVGINVDISNTANLTHTLTVNGSVKVETLMNLKPSNTPTSPSEGDVYYDSGLKKVRVWTGAAWENLN